jgi:hypothetical protein
MRPPFLTRRGMIGGAGIAASVPVRASGVDLKEFGGRPGEDIGAALSRALEQGEGAPINIGPGEFHLETPFVYRTWNRLPYSSRAPGLILIGSGSQRTIIDCMARGEAAIEIAQDSAYRFTVGGRLEGFTLRGNPKAPHQDGLRLSGAWNYTISDVEVTGFTGNGLSMPWREDLHWKLEDIEIVSGSKIARRRTKDGFSDATGLIGGLRMFGPGIAPGTAISRLVDETTLEMSVPATKSSIQTLEFVGNSDAFQSIVDLTRCRFVANEGWGLWGGAGIGADVSWFRTEVALNEAGGVFCGGSGWNLSGGAIFSNGGVGLLVDRVSSCPMLLNVERMEFDGNSSAHVWLKEVSTATFEHCRFISHYDSSEHRHRPETGLIVGNTPATRVARGIELKGCQFRSPPNEPSNYSAIRFGSPGGYHHVDIIEPGWITRASHHRLFQEEPDPGANVLVREDGATSFASSAARAWAVMERRSSQKIAPGRMVDLIFDRLQGDLAGNASAQRFVLARAVRGSNEIELKEPVPALKVGEPVLDTTGGFVADGSSILVASGRQLQISSLATASGEFGILIGGLRVPYAHVYEIDASVTLEGAGAGVAVELALTVNGRIARKSTLAAGAVSRQTATMRALLPLEAGVRVGLRVGQDGPTEITAVSGPEGGGFSIIVAA